MIISMKRYHCLSSRSIGVKMKKRRDFLKINGFFRIGYGGRRKGRNWNPRLAFSSQASTEHLSDSCDYLDIDRKHVLHPYSSMTSPLPQYPVAAANGVEIELEDGRKLIDGMSSWWACMHGYQVPSIDAAIKAQLKKMAHVMFGGITHYPAAALAERLVSLTPYSLQKVFLCDSGSVSVEVAMKMAVQYWQTLGQSRKIKFLTIRSGYHGDTFGAMSVCDPVNGMHSMFSGILAKQLFVEAPRDATESAAENCAKLLEDFLSRECDEIAGIVVEPIVQGAGGMKFYHPRLLKRIRKMCDKYDALLIFDEIATGFGRTGTLFACNQSRSTFKPWYSSSSEYEVTSRSDEELIDASSTEEVCPDILCLGKALTGGYMTMGATLTTEKVAEGISGGGGVFMHGPTFMGNPLACSAALASIELLLSSPWKARVGENHKCLVRALGPLSKLQGVREVRVLGAIGVVELREPVSNMHKVQCAIVDEGVWLRPFGKLLYTMPPFNSPCLTHVHIERIGKAIERAISIL